MVVLETCGTSNILLTHFSQEVGLRGRVPAWASENTRRSQREWGECITTGERGRWENVRDAGGEDERDHVSHLPAQQGFVCVCVRYLFAQERF